MNDLPKERLATTDERGSRVYLYPAAVRGYFRDRRIVVQTFLMLLFMVLPWIHIQGRQILLLDIARREFFIFGLHFRAHDTPLILFLLLSFTFLIGLVTAIWGRVWCGWACPQTVFTELLFRRIETWIEGSHRERKALDSAPWNGDKILKKSLKYFSFLLLSLLITHSFLAYFVGSYPLLEMISSSPIENWPSFLVILFTTALILFDFGWFREQFCVIMCPYGRFQSVLLSSHSNVVAYDSKRGEPRRGETGSAPQGDCVNCFRCVQVCPTGIDIRRGLQMECIACTACIDACDEVMTKTQKPLGLIRYTTLAQLAGKSRIIFQPRALLYLLLFLVSTGGLAITLAKKDFLELDILRAQGAPYEKMKNQKGEDVIMNHFHLEISNQLDHDVDLRFQLSDPNLELVMPMNPLHLKDNANQRVDFFVRFPVEILENGSKKASLKVVIPEHDRNLEVPLVGPIF